MAQGFNLHSPYPPKPNALPEVVRGASCIELDLVLCLHLPWLLCGNRNGCAWEQVCVKQVAVGREKRIQEGKRKGGPGKRRAVMHSPCARGVKGGGGTEEGEGRAGKRGGGGGRIRAMKYPGPWGSGLCQASTHFKGESLTNTPPYTRIYPSWHYEVLFLRRGARHRERAACCITTAAALVPSTKSKR